VVETSIDLHSLSNCKPWKCKVEVRSGNMELLYCASLRRSLPGTTLITCNEIFPCSTGRFVIAPTSAYSKIRHGIYYRKILYCTVITFTETILLDILIWVTYLATTP